MTDHIRKQHSASGHVISGHQTAAPVAPSSIADSNPGLNGLNPVLFLSLDIAYGAGTRIRDKELEASHMPRSTFLLPRLSAEVATLLMLYCAYTRSHSARCYSALSMSLSA